MFVLAFYRPTCLQRESHLVARILSFPFTSLQILHLTTCRLPFDPKQNFAHGSFVAQDSSNFLLASEVFFLIDETIGKLTVGVEKESSMFITTTSSSLF